MAATVQSLPLNALESQMAFYSIALPFFIATATVMVSWLEEVASACEMRPTLTENLYKPAGLLMV